MCLVGLVFASWPGSLVAQNNTCMDRTSTLSVIPVQGDASVDLTGTEFRGNANGKPVIVKSVTLDQSPRRIVLLLDLSKTTLGTTTDDRNVLFDTARELVAQMPPDTAIGLGVSTPRLKALVNFTNDHQQLLDAVAKLRTGERDAGWRPEDGAIRDAIRESRQWFGEHRFGDTVYVISDGYDFRSKITSKALSKELTSSGIRLFGLALLGNYLAPINVDAPHKVVTSNESVEYIRSVGEGPVDLQDMIRETGGFFVEVTRPSERSTIDPMLRQMALTPDVLKEKLKFQFRQILEVFRVEVQLHDSQSGPKSWKLDWKDMDKSIQKEFLMEYPKFLGPCSQQSSNGAIN